MAERTELSTLGEFGLINRIAQNINKKYFFINVRQGIARYTYMRHIFYAYVSFS